MNPRILVVWEDLGDKTKFINLPYSDVTAAILRQYHGHYINSTEAPSDMNETFFTEDGKFKFDNFASEEPQSGTFNLIIFCGMLP